MSWRPVRMAIFSLVPTAVGGGDDQRVGVARGLQVEQGAEAAEPRIRSRPCGGAGHRLDRLDQGLAGVDVHAGLRIGQAFTLITHQTLPIESDPRKGSPAPVAWRRGEAGYRLYPMTPITSNPELEAFCAYLADQPFIAVDTEFMREDHLLAQALPDPGGWGRARRRHRPPGRGAGPGAFLSPCCATIKSSRCFTPRARTSRF